MSNTYFEEMADKFHRLIGQKTMKGEDINLRVEFAKWFEHAYERGRYAGMRTILHTVKALRHEIDTFEREINNVVNAANVDTPT